MYYKNIKRPITLPEDYTYLGMLNAMGYDEAQETIAKFKGHKTREVILGHCYTACVCDELKMYYDVDTSD